MPTGENTVSPINGRDEKNFINCLALAPQPSRELLIINMSHAESMNMIFPQWIRLTYKRGPLIYEPYDINMPPTLIPRNPICYKYDDPLTERGQIVAQTYGRGLLAAKILPFEIYCSPDMKSVQTAFNLIKGLDTSFTSICIEPSLMSYRQMYPPNIQDIFLSSKMYSSLGYPINQAYAPLNEIPKYETIDEYFQRVQDFYFQRISKIEQKNVIVIGDNCLVEITMNRQIENVDDILKATKKTSCQLNAIKLKPRTAKLIDSPILPFTRCLYDVKPHLWDAVPKLAHPNHPDIDD